MPVTQQSHRTFTSSGGSSVNDKTYDDEDDKNKSNECDNNFLFQGSSSPASFVPFLSCMSRNSAAAAASSTKHYQSTHAPLVHAWRIVLKYYELKRGKEFNSAPQRKLSQSFGLDLSAAAGSTSAAVTASVSTSNKQSLLATVGQIIATHEPYRRSEDAKFKAFVCAGLK